MNKTTLNSQKEKHSIANFYPRSPCGERHLRMSLLFVCKNFYPRSPCGERRTGPVGGHIPDRISIHALLAESDVSSRKLPSSWRRFLSTLSLRRATRALAAKKLGIKISIHALLAESDGASFVMSLFYINFYPRSPCGERHFKKEILP